MKKREEEPDFEVGSDAGSQNLEEEEEQLVGVYLKAFCSGVNELLTVYKQHLLAIEHEYLRDRSLTIATLQLRLNVYTQLFPALTALMADI